MDIIEQIQQSRDKIQDIRATFKCYNPENNISLGNTDWGWKSEKQFHNTYISPPFEDGITTWYIRSDGKYYYLYHASEDGAIRKGCFGKLDERKRKILFSLNFEPKQLLGDSMNEHGQPFPDVLTKAQDITIRPESEMVDGHQCTVLEARNILGQDCRHRECLYSLLAWVDTTRDYRLLKLEGYQHLQGEKPYIEQNLRKRIGDIILREYVAVWFPISGNKQHYGIAHYLPNGHYFCDDMREEKIRDITKDFSKEDLKDHIADKLISLGCPLRLEIKNVQINQGINDEEFRIEYPKGCSVWDGITRKTYIVGQEHLNN